MRRTVFATITLSLLLVSCGNKTVKTEVVIGKEVLTTVMPIGKVEHPVHGAETYFGVGAISGEGKYQANGVAQLHVFENNSSLVDVRLNIEKAAAGFQYVAWIVGSDNVRVRIGELASILGDARHAVNASLKENLHSATSVIVTVQKGSVAKDTDPVVAMGTLKERKR